MPSRGDGEVQCGQPCAHARRDQSGAKQTLGRHDLMTALICRVVGVGTAQRGHNLHMMQLVTAPSGVSLQVRAVPVGTPARITNTPGTGIVDNLVWTLYLE